MSAVAAIALTQLAGASTGSQTRDVTYTAKLFMPGMRVMVPNAGWTLFEDRPGEFNLQAPAGATRGSHIRFLLDPRASAPLTVPLRASAGRQAR